VQHSHWNGFRFPGIDWPLQDLDPGGQLALDLPQDLNGLIGAAVVHEQNRNMGRPLQIFCEFFTSETLGLVIAGDHDDALWHFTLAYILAQPRNRLAIRYDGAIVEGLIIPAASETLFKMLGWI
jgi:hypothetical protein